MASFSLPGTPDDDAERRMAQLFGPGQVDQQIRQAIHVCWMMLPADRRNIDELEKEIRRIVERAFQSLREDADHFGTSNPEA
jgi:hypothetical protein